LVIAVSDITPAYTNSYSGQGTFSHRTRRVERLWRVFGYDAVDDVVVIFDQLKTTQAKFEKRWLLHTLEMPAHSESGFTVVTMPENDSDHSGGYLEGHVLLPMAAEIQFVGGKGASFLVDGVNYDEDGGVKELLGRRKGLEPGAWRIEVTPANDDEDNLFLVVMLPSKTPSPAHRIRPLNDTGRLGCEIAGPTRTTRWWFTPGRNGLDVDVVSGDGTTFSYPVWSQDTATLK
jgi:hypothetical protein